MKSWGLFCSPFSSPSPISDNMITLIGGYRLTTLFLLACSGAVHHVEVSQVNIVLTRPGLKVISLVFIEFKNFLL